MTPREFDAEVVQSRLRLIEGLLDDLDGVGDVTVEMLTHDRILRHAVERILSQLVELAVAINGHVGATVLRKAPTDYRSSFDLAVSAGLLDAALCDRLKPSVGLRNVLAHEYVEIDLSVVATATRSAAEDYRAYTRGVARWMRRA